MNLLFGRPHALSMTQPVSLQRAISPPPSRKAVHNTARSPNHISRAGRSSRVGTWSNNDDDTSQNSGPTLAAIEAGEAQIGDHLDHFSKHLGSLQRPSSNPRLPIRDFEMLYKRNLHQLGRHFVVHQHDHPISGITGHPPVGTYVG